MSEQILLLNPRRKRRRRHVNRRRRRHTNRRRRRMPAALRKYFARRSNPRRRRRRHVNRRHRSHRRRRSNPRRHRRYARRSNPRSFRRMGRGIADRYLMPAAIGAAGGIMLDIAWGYLSPKIVPANFQTGYAGLAAKLAVLFGGSWVLQRFVLKSNRARVITNRAVMGATTVLAYGALKGALQSVAPAGVPGLSGYMDYTSYALPGARMNGYMPRAGLGSLEDIYSPAAVIQPPGTPVPRQFGGYIAAQPGGLSAYQPHMMGTGGLMGYDWRNDGM